MPITGGFHKKPSRTGGEVKSDAHENELSFSLISIVTPHFNDDWLLYKKIKILILNI